MPLSKSEANRPIVVTPGDPAGIGPDISISVAASDSHSSDCIFVCDPSVLADRAQTLSTECTIHVMTSITDRLQGALNVWPVTCAHRITPGVITAHSAPYVLACLEAAFDLCEGGNASAWVTGPVNKAAFNEAGIAFSGHTEWIAARAGISRVVMMLAAGSFRVALVTTHLPLHAVPAAITDESFETTLRITDQSLRSLFKSKSPRLGICGLNPHAGESGYLGREEIEVLGPVIEKLRGEGMDLSNPLPADTLLTPQRIADYDAISRCITIKDYRYSSTPGLARPSTSRLDYPSFELRLITALQQILQAPVSLQTKASAARFKWLRNSANPLAH